MVLTRSVLAKPGTPTSKMCPPANRGGDLTDHLILAHDDLADFGEQGFVLGAERVEARFVVGKIHTARVA